MNEKLTLAQRGLELLDIGIGVFDGGHRLSYCNPAFRSLRKYPPDLCVPGVTLRALLLFNAERGDFGPGDAKGQTCDRLAEIEASDERHIMREMADGQVLKIRYQRLSADGLMITYEDCTAAHNSERDLKASEERYALVSEAAEEAIYDWHIAENRFFASPRLTRLIGVEVGVDGDRKWRWSDIIHSEDREQYLSALQDHLSGKHQRWSCEYRLKDASGDWRWVSDHGTSVRGPDGQAIRMVAALRDITDRITRDEALGASEERYALVTRATSDGIYDWNVTDEVLFVSENLTRLIDLDLTIQSSKAWARQIHPDDYERYLEVLRGHFKGATEAVECEYRLRAVGGGYRWVHDRGVGVRDRDGRVKRLVGAVKDITEIKEAHAKIERIEQRLMASLSTIADGILLVDPDNNVELFNDRYVKIFRDAADGADMSDVIVVGRSFFDMIRDGYNLGMFKPHPNGVNAWMANRTKAWQKQEAQWELELANGTWILLNERQLPDGGRVCVYTDITQFKHREAEAQAAKQRFEEAIEAISSGFALWDREDCLVVSNSKYREYFVDLADLVVPGTKFNDIIKAGIERGHFPLARENAEAYLRSIGQKRLQAAGETREQLINGLWLQVTDHRTRDGGIVSIYTDVTELKTKQLEIERQADILHVTMENMGQGISLVDRDLKTVAFNQKFLELMEFPREQFPLGFTMEQAFRYNAERGEYGSGDIDEQVRQRVQLAARFEAHRFERTRPDGTIIEIAGNPVGGGGFVATYTDITERKRGEEALKTALAEFDAVLENIDYGVVFMGADLRARIVNRAFREIWGMTKDFTDAQPSMRELIEYNRHRGLYDVAPEDWDAWISNRIETISAGPVPTMEMSRADGAVLTYQCVALPDGGRMLTYFDITELKKREIEISRARDQAETALADLHKAQERLVQAEKMASLGQLTAGIAHEIKNPLNFVNNFAKLSDELLDELADVLTGPIAALEEEDRLDAEDLLQTVHDNLAKINQHGRRADSIVKIMLQHSREGSSEVQVTDANAIAEEALNLAYHGARAENKDFNIELIKELTADPGEIECYPQELMRVLINLITNGMYAANKRLGEESNCFSPVITVKTRSSGDTVEVEVRDNGMGIPAELKQKIFLPFFTTKPAGEGTGLGLSLSYDIVVKQHGGTLTVDSKPGEYTAFVVALPRRLVQDASS